MYFWKRGQRHIFQKANFKINGLNGEEGPGLPPRLERSGIYIDPQRNTLLHIRLLIVVWFFVIGNVYNVIQPVVNKRGFMLDHYWCISAALHLISTVWFLILRTTWEPFDIGQLRLLARNHDSCNDNETVVTT